MIAAITIMGSFPAIRHYLSNRALWADEAALALNIMGRDFTQLIAPLDHSQIAPIGFLWLTESATRLFGSADERVLRLLPLLATLPLCALTYLTAMIARGRMAAIIASVLTVLSPSVIYYAAELKPYSLDMCATATLLWLAARSIEDPLSRRRTTQFTAAAAVLVIFSFPAILVSASLLSVVAFSHYRATRQVNRLLVLTSIPLATSTVVVYFLTRPSPETAQFMGDYWTNAFLKFPPGGPWELREAVRVLVDAFEQSFASRPSLLVAPVGLLALGTWLLAALGFGLRFESVLLLVAPWIAAIIAARLEIYPLEGRLAVYLLPTITVGVGTTMAALASDRFRSPLVLLPAAVVAALGINAAIVMQDSIKRVELASVLRDAARDWRPDEPVYVHFWSRRALAYYRHRFGRDWKAEFVIGQNHKADVAAYVQEIERIGSGRQRVWLLLSHVWNGEVYKSRLAPRWRVVKSIDHFDATAVQIERR
jgi:hypothetical protein